MFGITWNCALTFSIVSFMDSNDRSSIADENVAPKFRCVLSIPDFESLVQKKIRSLNKFYVDYSLKQE